MVGVAVGGITVDGVVSKPLVILEVAGELRLPKRSDVVEVAFYRSENMGNNSVRCHQRLKLDSMLAFVPIIQRPLCGTASEAAVRADCAIDKGPHVLNLRPLGCNCTAENK